ncbi:MAG: dienelactone hydrolase family protein, partial [bacterium]|nr:dienelactone hydrolase family protein [bacterium]
MKKRFLAALDLLKAEPSVNSEKLGAIGYCFGGAVVLNMAREGVDLDGVVSFHGSLKTSRPAEPGRVNAAILVLNGASDPFVTEEEKAAFTEEMDAAGVAYEFIDYPGVKHSFTNREATEIGRKFELPLEYNEAADSDSWERMNAFLSRVFG